MSIKDIAQVSDIAGNGVEGHSSKKRRLSISVDDVTYKKPKVKKKKNKKPKNDQHNDDIDIENSLNRSIGQMNIPLLADYFAQRTKRFSPNLSLVELQDRQIPGKGGCRQSHLACFVDDS